LWILGFSSRGRSKNLARFGMRTRTKPKRRLLEVYKYAGFRPRAAICEAEGDAGTLVIHLDRRSKKHSAAVVAIRAGVGTTAGCGKSAIWVAADIGSFWSWKRDGLIAADAAG
jgi:hypothetical protein